MHQYLGRALLTIGLASQLGCFRATFQADPSAVRGQEHEEWTTFFLFGLVGEETLDVSRFCPSGQVAEVQTGMSFTNGLLTALTIGIYSPRRVTVTCAGGDSAGLRELQIVADSEGHPVRAVVATAAGTAPVDVQASGPDQWQLSVKELSK